MRAPILAQIGWLSCAPARPERGRRPREPMPIIRNVASGVPMTAAIERLAGPGKAAKTRPSIDEHQSDRGEEIRHAALAPPPTSPALQPQAAEASRGLSARLAGRVVEVTEEVAVRLEQQPRVVRLEPGLVGLHRAVEGEEIRILVEGIGEDLVAGGVALAADLAPTSTSLRRPARSPRGRRASGFPARAAAPGRGIPPPRADVRSACADRPPGCSAPAGRRGECARRPPRCRSPPPRD